VRQALKIVLVLLVSVAPASAIQTKFGDANIQFTLGALYDSNLLKYSASDRTNFLNESETYKSPIRALDDLRTDYKVSVELRNKFWKKRLTSFRVTADFAHHAMNPIKNLGWLSLSARHDFSKAWITNIGYFFEPKFFIRDYTDSHTGLRQHCDFSLNQLKGDLTYRPNSLYDFTGHYKYKAYRYNEFFTEYDGDSWALGLNTVYRPGDWRFSAGYTFEKFDNSGFSSSDLIPANSGLTDSEFGQGDYEEDAVTGSARYSFIGLRREMYLQCNIEGSKRAFTTGRDAVIDAMHSGREDIVVEFSIVNQISLTKQVGIELGIGAASRDSDATDPKVGDLKDYKRTTAWIEISYELK